MSFYSTIFHVLHSLGQVPKGSKCILSNHLKQPNVDMFICLFVLHCGQRSSLLWTSALRPHGGPVH